MNDTGDRSKPGQRRRSRRRRDAAVLRVSAPGNLLLCGEYAVLEPGGLGIAAAIPPRAAAEIRPAETPAVRCRIAAGGEHIYYPGRRAAAETRLPEVCLTYLLQRGLVAAPPAAEIVVDTRAFFTSSGGKRGFGSSAAATVVCTAALLHAAGMARRRIDEVLSEHGVAIHRELQRGRGSGYDVLASTIGGVVLFTGGRRPTAEPVSAAWLEGALLASAADSVRTTDAVGRYEAWKRRRPDEAAAFRSVSNELVLRLAAARRRPEVLAELEKLATIGIELGEAIGVPARLPRELVLRLGERFQRACETPGTLRGGPAARTAVCKALGAGNELAVCIPYRRPHPTPAPDDCDTIQPLQVTSEGISWEETE